MQAAPQTGRKGGRGSSVPNERWADEVFRLDPPPAWSLSPDSPLFPPPPEGNTYVGWYGGHRGPGGNGNKLPHKFAVPCPWVSACGSNCGAGPRCVVARTHGQAVGQTVPVLDLGPPVMGPLVEHHLSGFVKGSKQWKDERALFCTAAGAVRSVEAAADEDLARVLPKLTWLLLHKAYPTNKSGPNSILLAHVHRFHFDNLPPQLRTAGQGALLGTPDRSKNAWQPGTAPNADVLAAEAAGLEVDYYQVPTGTASGAEEEAPDAGAAAGRPCKRQRTPATDREAAVSTGVGAGRSGQACAGGGEAPVAVAAGEAAVALDDGDPASEGPPGVSLQLPAVTADGGDPGGGHLPSPAPGSLQPPPAQDLPPAAEAGCSHGNGAGATVTPGGAARAAGGADGGVTMAGPSGAAGPVGASGSPPAQPAAAQPQEPRTRRWAASAEPPAAAAADSVAVAGLGPPVPGSQHSRPSSEPLPALGPRQQAEPAGGLVQGAQATGGLGEAGPPLEALERSPPACPATALRRWPQPGPACPPAEAPDPGDNGTGGAHGPSGGVAGPLPRQDPSTPHSAPTERTPFNTNGTSVTADATASPRTVPASAPTLGTGGPPPPFTPVSLVHRAGVAEAEAAAAPKRPCRVIGLGGPGPLLPAAEAAAGVGVAAGAGAGAGDSGHQPPRPLQQGRRPNVLTAAAAALLQQMHQTAKAAARSPPPFASAQSHSGGISLPCAGEPPGPASAPPASAAAEDPASPHSAQTKRTPPNTNGPSAAADATASAGAGPGAPPVRSAGGPTPPFTPQLLVHQAGVAEADAEVVPTRPWRVIELGGPDPLMPAAAAAVAVGVGVGVGVEVGVSAGAAAAGAEPGGRAPRPSQGRRLHVLAEAAAVELGRQAYPATRGGHEDAVSGPGMRLLNVTGPGVGLARLASAIGAASEAAGGWAAPPPPPPPPPPPQMESARWPAWQRRPAAAQQPMTAPGPAPGPHLCPSRAQPGPARAPAPAPWPLCDAAGPAPAGAQPEPDLADPGPSDPVLAECARRFQASAAAQVTIFQELAASRAREAQARSEKALLAEQLAAERNQVAGMRAAAAGLVGRLRAAANYVEHERQALAAEARRREAAEADAARLREVCAAEEVERVAALERVATREDQLAASQQQAEQARAETVAERKQRNDERAAAQEAERQQAEALAAERRAREVAEAEAAGQQKACAAKAADLAAAEAGLARTIERVTALDGHLEALQSGAAAARRAVEEASAASQRELNQARAETAAAEAAAAEASAVAQRELQQARDKAAAERQELAAAAEAAERQHADALTGAQGEAERERQAKRALEGRLATAESELAAEWRGREAGEARLRRELQEARADAEERVAEEGRQHAEALAAARGERAAAEERAERERQGREAREGQLSEAEERAEREREARAREHRRAQAAAEERQRRTRAENQAPIAQVAWLEEVRLAEAAEGMGPGLAEEGAGDGGGDGAGAEGVREAAAASPAGR